jgi:hypothetical protein
MPILRTIIDFERIGSVKKEMALLKFANTSVSARDIVFLAA